MIDILRDRNRMKRVKNIIENVTINYKNGEKQFADAIRITDNGIYLCHLNSSNGKVNRFEDHSFIPLDQIGQISFCNDKGKTQDINLKNIKTEENKT